MSDQFNTCLDAITHHTKVKPGSVSKYIEDIKCVQKVSSCNWVGNGIVYTCLKNPTETPPRVYAGFKSGGHSKLITSPVREKKN